MAGTTPTGQSATAAKVRACEGCDHAAHEAPCRAYVRRPKNPNDRACRCTTFARIKHYAYCKDRDCTGCLPTDEELADFPIIALWGEMLARCIEQTPFTKTHDGALNVLLARGSDYRSIAHFARLWHFNDERLRAIVGLLEDGGDWSTNAEDAFDTLHAIAQLVAEES